MNNKALSLLGIAMRAGKLITGDDTLLKAIRSRKVLLVIVAGDASDNTKKKYRDKCSTYQVTLIEALDRFSLGQAIGKAERVLIGITDAGFAASLERSLKPFSEVE